MKKITLFSSALMASVLFASSVAMAAPHEQHHRLDINVSKLDMRIEAGVKDGKLTPMEERELRTELRELSSAVKSAMTDHHKVTKSERFSLEAQETALDQHITKLANNRAVVKQDDRHEAQGRHHPEQGHFEQNKGDRQEAPVRPDHAYEQHQRMPHAQR